MRDRSAASRPTQTAEGKERKWPLVFPILKTENWGISDDLGGLAVLVAPGLRKHSSGRLRHSFSVKLELIKYISRYHFLNGLLAIHCANAVGGLGTMAKITLSDFQSWELFLDTGLKPCTTM